MKGPAEDDRDPPATAQQLGESFAALVGGGEWHVDEILEGEPPGEPPPPPGGARQGRRSRRRSMSRPCRRHRCRSSRRCSSLAARR
jgi:hypothetical protein